MIRFDQATAEFLYREGDTLHVMNPETFDQFEMHIDQLGAAACDYLQEGMKIQLGMHDSQIMRAEMPAQVLIAVKDTDARLKNATGTSWKKATLTNGRVISVPPIINPGQNVWVRPQTDEFVRKQD